MCEGDESAAASLATGDFRCEEEECTDSECWCYGSDYEGSQCYEADQGL